MHAGSLESMKDEGLPGEAGVLVTFVPFQNCSTSHVATRFPYLFPF